MLGVRLLSKAVRCSPPLIQIKKQNPRWAHGAHPGPLSPFRVKRRRIRSVSTCPLQIRGSSARGGRRLDFHAAPDPGKQRPRRPSPQLPCLAAATRSLQSRQRRPGGSGGRWSSRCLPTRRSAFVLQPWPPPARRSASVLPPRPLPARRCAVVLPPRACRHRSCVGSVRLTARTCVAASRRLPRPPPRLQHPRPRLLSVALEWRGGVRGGAVPE